MALSVQDLMNPRYKIIADYPGCSFPLGEILIPDKAGELYSITAGYSWSVTRIMEKDVRKFPHLVKPLQWWEERSESEMPEYIRINQTWVVKAKKHYVAHPRYGEKGKWFEAADSSAIEPFYAYSSVSGPATETEYNDYLQSLKQKQ